MYSLSFFPIESTPGLVILLSLTEWSLFFIPKKITPGPVGLCVFLLSPSCPLNPQAVEAYDCSYRAWFCGRFVGSGSTSLLPPSCSGKGLFQDQRVNAISWITFYLALNGQLKSSELYSNSDSIGPYVTGSESDHMIGLCLDDSVKLDMNCTCFS
ncbi:hypothetical protein GOODEAATRI_025340 [Goodea atripinnis]|uniref:Uncharacterized protein n=1 Tax=Goodea atripinnis TaxID=208336 RepID=A0ABV0Q137_9TELE